MQERSLSGIECSEDTAGRAQEVRVCAGGGLTGEGKKMVAEAGMHRRTCVPLSQCPLPI